VTSRLKTPALRRWLSPLVAFVVVLALAPGAALAASAPGSPQNLAATAGDKQVALTWAAPASDGGAAITDYRVQYRAAGASTWVTYPDGTSTNLFATVTLLVNGTTYDFRVRAINSVGLGAISNVVSATPTTANPGAPGIPGGLTPTAGNKQVALTWTEPSNGGSPITDYGVQYRPVGGTWATYPDGTSTNLYATVTLLTNGTEYELRVRARNAVGWGAWSAAVRATPAAAVVPTMPLSLVATPGDARMALTWAAPASDGGSAITDYVVQYKKSTALTWTTYPDGTSTNLFATVTLLVNGTSYDFRVRAKNAVGLGAYSNSVSAVPTPPAVPSMPLNLAATPGNHQVALTWNLPASDGGAAITDYVVQFRIGSDPWSTFADGTSTNLFATVTGLTNGTTYEFQVRAVNSAGGGAWANVFATLGTVPGAPTGLTPTAGNQQVALAWTAPASDGGAAITDYVVQYRIGSGPWTSFPDGTSTNLFATVTSLANGTEYEFQVQAVNLIGGGAFSSPAFATPTGLPGVPQSLAAAPGNGQVTLTWAAPSYDGGSAIIDYAIQWRTTGSGSWTLVNPAASGAIVSSLANGTSYEFQVQARNANGSGAWSASVTAAPRTVPGIPQSLAAAPGNGQVTLTWAAPASDGGSAIIDYAIQWRTTGSGSWTLVNPAASGLIVSSLANGTSYEFQVQARNIAGSGSWSVSATATPATVPGIPQSLAAVPGNGSVTLTWAAPAFNGGSAIIDYAVQWRTGSGSWTLVNPAASGGAVTLPNGTPSLTYEFQVRARNAIGSGSWSASVFAAPGVPGVPQNLTASLVIGGLVWLFWDAPASNNGASITDYQVQYCKWSVATNSCLDAWTTYPDGTGTGTNAFMTGFANATLYAFQVRAVNSRGPGAWSASFLVTTGT
jgi:large repetitive protein